VIDSQSLLTDFSWNNRDGTTTRDDTLHVLPSTSNTTTVLLQQLLQRNRHFLLNDAWVVDVSGDTEDLCSRVSLTTETSEPRSSTTSDSWGNSDGLNVGDGRWASEQSDIGRERGLQSWFTLLTLNRLDQGSFLSTNVSTGTSVKVDVKCVSGTASVFADESSFVSLVDGLLKVGCFLVEFSSDVNVGCGSAFTLAQQGLWM